VKCDACPRSGNLKARYLMGNEVMLRLCGSCYKYASVEDLLKVVGL
jgi:hypothetical protein